MLTPYFLNRCRLVNYCHLRSVFLSHFHSGGLPLEGAPLLLRVKWSSIVINSTRTRNSYCIFLSPLVVGDLTPLKQRNQSYSTASPSMPHARYTPVQGAHWSQVPHNLGIKDRRFVRNLRFARKLQCPLKICEIQLSWRTEATSNSEPTVGRNSYCIFAGCLLLD